MKQRLTVQEYVDGDYNAKQKSGECNVYWDEFGVDAIVRHEVDEDAYHISYGGLYSCGVGGYVGLWVRWNN